MAMGPARGLERAQEGRIEEKGGREGSLCKLQAQCTRTRSDRGCPRPLCRKWGGDASASSSSSVGLRSSSRSFRWPYSNVGERDGGGRESAADDVINDVLCCAGRPRPAATTKRKSRQVASRSLSLYSPKSARDAAQ